MTKTNEGCSYRGCRMPLIGCLLVWIKTKARELLDSQQASHSMPIVQDRQVFRYYCPEHLAQMIEHFEVHLC